MHKAWIASQQAMLRRSIPATSRSIQQSRADSQSCNKYKRRRRRVIFLLAFAFATFPLLFAAEGRAQGLKSGKFKIEKTAGLSASDELASLTGKNNRITGKVQLGSAYTYIAGLFLEPRAIIRKRDGSFVSLAFVIRAETITNPIVGRQSLLGNIRELLLIVDGNDGGDLVVFPVTDATKTLDYAANYDPDTLTWMTVVSERGLAAFTPQQLHQIARSRGVSLKIVGSELSVVIHERDVTKSFFANLRAFEVALAAEQSSRRPDRPQ